MIKVIRSTIFLQATGYLLQLGAFFTFARILGSEAQGILTIFRVMGQIIASLVWLGLPAGTVYFVSKDKDLFLSVLRNCLKWFAFVFPLVIVCFHVLPISGIPKLNVIEQYIPFLFVFIFFVSYFNLFQGLMLSMKKYLYYNLFASGLGIIIFGFSVLTGLLPESHNRLTFAIMAYIMGYGLMFVYGFVLTIVEKHKQNTKRKNILFLDQFIVGFRGFVSGMAGLLLFRLDLFLVGYFLSFTDVGVYSVALFSAEMITKIPYWCSSLLIPMVASNELNHVKRTVYLFYSSIIVAFTLGLVFLSIITIFPRVVSGLIGEDFAGVEVCLLLLLPRVIMQSGVGVLAANLAGKGYPWYHPVGTILALCCVVLFDIILIPKLGIMGAALANSLGFSGGTIIFWFGFKKHNTTMGISLKSYFGTVVRSLGFS